MEVAAVELETPGGRAEVWVQEEGVQAWLVCGVGLV